MAKKISRLEDLTPDSNNFNRHTEFGNKLLEDSLRKFGAGRSILTDKDGNIIAGNGVTEVAAAIGMEDVEVVHTDGKKLVVVVRDDLELDSPEGRELALADNMTALKGIDLDLDKVRDTLGDDMAKAWGMELPKVAPEAKEDDFDPEAPVVTVCQDGDIWQLGNHRLMCGDSTDAGSVALLMNGEKADLCFTDPPYGISTKGGRQQTFAKRGMTDIENDNRIGEDLVGFLTAVFNAMPLADDASVYVCYPWKTQAEFTEAIRQSGLRLKACIVWDKKVFGLNGSQHGYRPQHELIYFACKGNYKWYGDKSQSDIWQVSREINREEQGNHPTPKPVALCGKAIVNSSTGTDIVLDLFGGSGTTLIAAEQLNRKCYMMELDPHYCDVIIARWEKLTGKKAQKITNVNIPQ